MIIACERLIAADSLTDENFFSIESVASYLSERDSGGKVYKFLRKRKLNAYEISRRLVCGLLSCPKTYSECWKWRKPRVHGYGSLRIDGKDVYAHRISYWLFTGKEPGDFEVMHLCDVRRCINPTHLALGTHRDNMLDAFLKGRIPPPPKNDNRGSANGMSKLTESDVLEIKRLIGQGTIAKNIAKKFGVTDGAIHGIRSGKYWSHVERPVFP